MTGVASKSSFHVDLDVRAALCQAVEAGRMQERRDKSRVRAGFWVVPVAL